MSDLSLVDLVRNGTMSAEIAGTLAAAAAERRSMLFFAVPRLAGKSTTMHAALAHAPEGTPMHSLTRAAGPGLAIPEQGDGGYLVLAEISPAGFAEYFWGEDVRTVFAALDRGFSLATALHAPDVREAFEVICGENRVPDEHAGRIDLAVCIRSLGDDWRNPTGRRVEEVHEVDHVEGGVPAVRLLHRWDETSDTFKAVEPPARIGTEATVAPGEHADEFRRLATAARPGDA